MIVFLVFSASHSALRLPMSVAAVALLSALALCLSFALLLDPSPDLVALVCAAVVILVAEAPASSWSSHKERQTELVRVVSFRTP